jgi:hypothetical protein
LQGTTSTAKGKSKAFSQPPTRKNSSCQFSCMPRPELGVIIGSLDESLSSLCTINRSNL